MFETIWNELYWIVDWLIASTTLSVAYNYDNNKWTEYPYCTITPSDYNETIYDNTVNQLEIPYVINLYDERDQENLEDVESKLRTLVDQILYELRRNPTLNWKALRATFWVRWGYSDDNTRHRVVQITCNYFTITPYI